MRDTFALIAGRTGTARPKLAIVFVAAIGTAVVLAGCSAQGVSQDEFDDAVTEIEVATNDVARVTAELATAEQQLAIFEQRVVELEEAIVAQGTVAETLEREAADDLGEAQRLLTEALADKERAERLVAELILAYSDDFEAAMTALANGATSFACDWGTGQATNGQTLDSVTGRAALTAFAASDSFRGLVEVPEIATALSVAETLGNDLYGVDPGEIETIAVACWQEEDVRLNAALYQHQGVFREAVLDAACTSGASEAFEDRGGYWWTAVYLDWELTVGNDDAQAYEQLVKDRFGSIKEFVSIPDADIQAESARCDDIRDLIEPKRSGTWNVGDEIKAGTWKAYDVSDCYWARLAENGDIRDNHFGDGLRLTVNVLPSDGQLEISGCVFFYPNP